MTSEGYVGITTRTVRQRYTQHVNDAKKGSPYTFHEALRNFDNLEVETLVEASLEYCRELEHKLRPLPNIGWNVAIGGGGRQGPREVSEEVKYNLQRCRELRWSDPAERNKHSELMKSRGANESSMAGLANYIATTKPWNRGSAVKKTWLLAGEAYTLFVNGHSTAYKLSKKFGITVKSAGNLIKQFNNNWIPFDDQEWLQWYSANN